MVTTAIKPASEKQVAFIETLGREVGHTITGGVLSTFAVANPSQLSSKDASKAIDTLIQERDRVKAERLLMQETKAAVEGLSQGMYMTRNGDIIRVYPTQTTKMLVAKRLNVPDNADEKPTWTYLGLASRVVSEDMRVSLDRVIQFGLDFGICGCCGRILENPESIAAGIGPICRENFG